ncbi:MAG: nucleoside triphosphate pyrophosphohydrolase [Thermoplasmata archaeon]
MGSDDNQPDGPGPEAGHMDPGHLDAGHMDRALELVRFLRVECPWDRKQTPESLVPHLLEEAHEVVDAIQEGHDDDLEGELGDLLLNLSFQIVLGEERRAFTAASVMDRLEKKMHARHPHLFGLGEKEDWEVLKARERQTKFGEEGASVLAGIPTGLDPLHKAHRIQDRVSGVGFDWADATGALEKVQEEIGEVREALDHEEFPRLEEELGDLLFAVVNLVRLAGGHSATSLDRANRNFSRRFERLEVMAAEMDISIPDATLEVLDQIWDEVKIEEG